MATATPTARCLDLLKPQRNRYEVFDTIVPGFAIRVTPAGHKSFTLHYRHHGRLRRVGLGRYPDVLLADAEVGHGGARTNFRRCRSGGREEGGARDERRHGRRAVRLVQNSPAEREELDGDSTHHGARSPARLAASPWGRFEATPCARAR